MGGLADTVKEYDPKAGKGNGFTFTQYSSMDLFAAIQRAGESDRQPLRQRPQPGGESLVRARPGHHEMHGRRDAPKRLDQQIGPLFLMESPQEKQ